MVIQYKCPNCGTDMDFDNNTGTLCCNSCDHEEIIEGYQKDFETFESTSHFATFGDEEARQYLCKNCGAILVTDNHTAATICNFCGSPMSLGERISGDYAPTKIIPFRISKADAIKAFQKWRKKLKFSPKEFSKGNRIKEVVGMYVPFWLYDLRGQGEARLHCTRTHTFENEEETVTKTRHFDVYRKMDLTFRNVPADASEKLADDLMDNLGPFDYSGMKEFNTSYLAGFLSEKYSYTDEELLPDVKKRTEKYIDEFVTNTLEHYDSSDFVDRDYNIGQLSSSYALFPVWMVYYDYNDADYIFAMNGQTGKLAGNPPISKSKVAIAVALITFFAFLLCRVITMLLGGPLL